MTLTTCPECGQRVSDQAQVCEYCACSLDAQLKSDDEWNFEFGLALLELTLGAQHGNLRSGSSEKEFQEKVDQSRELFKFLTPLANTFLSVVKGAQPDAALGYSSGGTSPLNFPARFLKAPSTAALQGDRRATAEALLTESFLLGVMEHLILWEFPTRSAIERVDQNELLRKWGLDSMMADVKMKGLNDVGDIRIESLYDRLWRARLEPVLKQDFKVGYFSIGRCKSFLRNVFYAGASLVMDFDLLTQERPEPHDPGLSRTLSEIRQRFANARLSELVQHQIRKMDSAHLATACSGTRDSINRHLPTKTADEYHKRWLNQILDQQLWGNELSATLDAMISDARMTVSNAGVTIDDTVLFDMFNRVVLDLSASASVNANLREQMRIRK